MVVRRTCYRPGTNLCLLSEIILEEDYKRSSHNALSEVNQPGSLRFLELLEMEDPLILYVYGEGTGGARRPATLDAEPDLAELPSVQLQLFQEP